MLREEQVLRERQGRGDDERNRPWRWPPPNRGDIDESPQDERDEYPKRLEVARRSDAIDPCAADRTRTRCAERRWSGLKTTTQTKWVMNSSPDNRSHRDPARNAAQIGTRRLPRFSPAHRRDCQAGEIQPGPFDHRTRDAGTDQDHHLSSSRLARSNRTKNARRHQQLRQPRDLKKPVMPVDGNTGASRAPRR